jgi:serine phosphatase RsbU (regulator of sigma subunit)
VRTGGDFFDAIAIGQHVIFLLTDIAGTRTNSHTIAASAQDTFRSRAPELFGTPDVNLTDAISTLAHDINHTLITATAHGICFAPTFLACFDLSLSILTYINAGGQPAIFRDTDGTRTLTNACMPLGLFSLLTFEPGIQAFEPGARLLLVTKGVIEERSGQTPFGAGRVTDLLQGSTTNSALDLCQDILEQAHQFDKPSWYRLSKLHLTRPKRTEDLTAVALVRPA